MLFAGPIELRADGDTIVVDPGPQGDVYGGFETIMPFQHRGGAVYQTADGNNQIALYDGPFGPRLASSLGYHGVFQPVAFAERSELHLALALFWGAMAVGFALWQGWFWNYWALL